MQPSPTRFSENVTPESASGRSANGGYKAIFHFFGLRENPFHIGPDPRYLSFTRQIQGAFDALTYGIQTNQGLMVLTGEVGTGKTTITRHLLEWLRERHTPTSYIFNSRLDVGDLFDFVLADFGIPSGSNQKTDKAALLTEWSFTRHAVGKTPVLIVDEAHGLPLSVLEEIRLLLNPETPRKKLLQIVLVGQPELEEKLGRRELRQLRQRVAVHCKIGSLNSAETHGYIHRRVRIAGSQGDSVFQSDAINAVHSYSAGIPRVINILCERALINAYAAQIRPVPPQIVEEVAQELQLDNIGALDARLDFGESARLKVPAARPIAAILRAHSVGATELAPTEQGNVTTNHAPVPVGDKNLAPNTPPAPKDVGIASAGLAERVAPWLRWMTSFCPTFDQSRRRWEKSISTLNFEIFHRAASSVIRWLQQPVRPVRARRESNRGQRSGPAPVKIVFARVHGEIRKGFSRLCQAAKTRLES